MLEDRTTHPIEEIIAAKALVESLHLRVVNRGCAAAHETLSALGCAAQELIDEIYQQDFMNLQLYKSIAEETGDLCTCDLCLELREASRRHLLVQGNQVPSARVLRFVNQDSIPEDAR